LIGDSIQLDFIRWLHQVGNPAWDSFFKFLNFFDTLEFLFILIPLVWIGYSWRLGMRLFYILILSGFITMLLKNVFALPRPYWIDPSLGLIKVSGYGFPSGGAQVATLLSGILITTWKSRWAWIIGFNFFFWISLSRLYLGVHFITDVIGGWAIGLALWALYAIFFPRIEKRLQKWSLPSLLSLSLGIPILLLPLAYSLSVLPQCSVALGAAIGIFFATLFKQHLPDAKSWKEFFWRGTIGVGGVFLLYVLVGLLGKSGIGSTAFIQFFVLGLWVSVGATWFLKRRFWRRG
jgi:undecaprenyl-diphosphatase